MIEINLSPSKKAGSITNLGGIDLSLINVKMFVFAFLFLYIPESFLVDYFDGQIQKSQNTYKKLNMELKKLGDAVASMDGIQKQVDALNEQEKKLAQKLGTVKEIINKRQNPYEVLKYIVNNIPQDVWLKSLVLNGNTIIMQGYSAKWKSIGGFIESLKNSIFFDKQIDYSRPDSLSGENSGQRVEVFEIKTQVIRYK